MNAEREAEIRETIRLMRARLAEFNVTQPATRLSLAMAEDLLAAFDKLNDRCASYAEDVESLNGCVARLETALYEARDEAVKMRDEWKSRATFAEQELSEAKRVVDRLRAERRQLRRRLLECRSWVGVCPLEPARINEMCLIRDLADDTLNEVPDDD